LGVEERMSVQHVKNNNLKIGITGNIASGKSTAVTYLKAKGYDVIDSDEIVRTLWKHQDIIEALSIMFNRDLKDHHIKQAFIEEVFLNDTIRHQLESYLHPKVYEEIEKQIKMKSGMIFIDIPLLYETSYEHHLDAVILISVDKDIQLNRLKKRGFTHNQAVSRIDSQMKQEEKIKKTTHIVSGTLGFESFYQALEKEIEIIIHEAH
jgi:dephospho-CoA kinase